MASCIALVLLVSALGANAASSPNDVQWRPRPRVEYEFELSSRSLAGLPALQGQYSGVQYGGRVRVQGLTADTAIVKLESLSWSALHGRLAEGWWSSEPQANDTFPGHGHRGTRALPLSGSAAVARFKDGQVSTVLVGRKVRDWEVNLLQGVLGHLQIQTGSGGNGLRGSEQQEQSVYRVLENGVSGRCMVQYEVSPAIAPAEMSAFEKKMCSGKPFVQITKTKNFTDCQQYAEQRRGLPRCPPGGNACASLWARNSVTQMIGCGSGAEMQLMQAVSSSSMQAELQIRDDSRAAVFSSVNMTLVRVEDVRQRIAMPKDGVVINDLGYRVAGKQVNGDWGLDSSYSDSSEEHSDDSVEVIRHPSRKHSSKQADSSSEDSNASSSPREQAVSHSHRKNDSSSSADSVEDQNSHGKNRKNQWNSEEDQKSHGKNRKNQWNSDEDQNSHGKNRKNQWNSDEDQNSHGENRKNQWDSDEDQNSHGKNRKNQWNSDEDQNSHGENRKNQWDSDEDQNSHGKNRKNQWNSDEDQKSHGKNRTNQWNSDEDQNSHGKNRKNQWNSDEDQNSHGKNRKNQWDSDEDQNSHGKNRKNQWNSDEDQNSHGKNRKNQWNSDEDQNSHGKNRKNQWDSDEDQNSHGKNRKNQWDSDEDQKSHGKNRKNQWDSDEDQKSHGKNRKNQWDSDEDQKSHGKNRKNQWDSDESQRHSDENQRDSEEDQNSHGKNRKNQRDSDEDQNSNQMHWAGKHSRKTRGVKLQQNGDDDVPEDDAFAGTLSPAAVQANTTLRAALQLRLVQDLTKVAAELGRPEGPSTRSMERLSMAVRLTRALGAPQLRAVQSQLADQPAKELFRDVLAMCGSVPCVEQTITMIKERKMSSMAAQLALNSLADRVSVPSRIVLKYLQDLYTSSSDEQVKVSAALALGELAGRAARPLAAATASFLADQLSGPSSASLKVPLIFALGRTAAPQAVRTLIAKAKSKEVAPYQRAQSVLALTASALRSPSAVRGALLALLHDPTESAPVRMAAVSLLAYTRPSLPVWQRLAVSTFYEPNLAVASYVWSTIDSFAKMRDPNYGQQTQFARLALPLARRLPQGAHLAFNVVAGSVDAQLDRMVHQHAAYHSHVDAASAYYRRVTRFAGITSLDQEVDLWGANPDELMQAAMQVVFGPQDLKAKASARPATDVPHSTRSIHEKLNIVKRNLQNPQGHLRVTLQPFLKNLFLTFDKDTPTNIANAAKRCMSKLSSEAPFHVQHLGGEEMSVSTVNEMGFPVTLRIQAPWLVRAEGSAQLLNYQSAQANATLLYSAGLIAQLSVQPSWDTREHVAAVSGHAMVHFSAATLRAQVNATAGRVFLQLEPAAERSHSVLARLSAQPMTASVDLSRAELATESVTAHNASRVQGLAMGTAPQPVELSTWSEMSLSLRAPVERPALVGWLRQSRTVLGFPVLGRPLTASRAEMIVSHPHAINANFSLVKGMLQRGDLDVVYPSSLRQDNLVSDIVTSTEKPLATTESSTASTTQQPSANNQPVIAEARSARRAQNGSVFVDDGDVDFSASVFNATTLNPYTNRINGSSELFVLSQVLAGMTAGRGYVVGVNVTTEPAYESSPPYTYSGFWAFGANLGRRLTRAGLFARSDSDNAQMAATAAIFRDIPARADLDKALRQPPSLMIKAEYQQIDATAVKKVITAALETSRTALKDRLLWQSARQQQCIAPDQVKDDNVAVDAGCRELLRTANTPDQFNLTINYNNPAEEAWKNGMHAFFQASRAYLNNKGNVFVDSLTTGNDNELGAGLTVQPDGTLDGWLQTPRTMTKVAASNTWTPASLLAAVNSDSGAYCGLTASRLVTLDGAKGNFELSSCWHLLAKDCSGKSRVAVLARADKPKSKEILVEINVDNYQVAQLSPDGSAVLNGVAVANQTDQAGSAVEVRDANDVSVMTIVRAEDGAWSVQLRDHGLSVLYGNNTVIVQVGASLQGRLCGMCGNYGGKASADLLNPQNKVEKTIQSFADSYALDCNTKGLQ